MNKMKCCEYGPWLLGSCQVLSGLFIYEKRPSLLLQGKIAKFFIESNRKSSYNKHFSLLWLCKFYNSDFKTLAAKCLFVTNTPAAIKSFIVNGVVILKTSYVHLIIILKARVP
jgi:hypothetical protein